MPDFNPDEKDAGTSKENKDLISSVDQGFELWQPNKPVSVKEVIEEMEKAGRRGLTLEELKKLMQEAGPIKIEPRADDIVIEDSDPKKLSE